MLCPQASSEYMTRLGSWVLIRGFSHNTDVSVVSSHLPSAQKDANPSSGEKDLISFGLAALFL